MSDLVDFLRARLDEDEQAAKGAPWELDNEGWPFWIDAPIEYDSDAAEAYRDRFTPTRVLREVEAKRRTVALHCDPRGGDPSCSSIDYPENAEDCETLLLLTLPYADHPDYRQEWAVRLASDGCEQ